MSKDDADKERQGGERVRGDGSFDHGDDDWGRVCLEVVLRVSSRPVSNRSKARGAAESMTIVGQSVIPIHTLPSPSTQGLVCHQRDLKGRSWSGREIWGV